VLYRSLHILTHRTVIQYYFK